ncbi:hypothetical protein, partial [Salmonella enterica]|uniref:hypothetical protein n=1 Tax=Salmonella enterica TaxID=28901 RepID=UPI001AD9A9A4
LLFLFVFFFQGEDGIRVGVASGGFGNGYKRQLLNYVNGPLSKFALYLSVGVWGGYGVFSGIYGYLNLRKILKLKRANEESRD